MSLQQLQDQAKEATSQLGSADRSEPGELYLDRYKAVQNKDGTWTIFDVDIFCELERVFPVDGEEKNFVFDKNWLSHAVFKAQEKFQQDKYLPTLHLGHNREQEGEAEVGGLFLPKAVRRGMYQGQEVWKIFSDWLLPDHTYQKIKGMKLPYRSIEVNDFESGEISSCALLQSKPPWVKGAPLIVEETTPDKVGPSAFVQTFKPTGVMMFSEAGVDTLVMDELKSTEMRNFWADVDKVMLRKRFCFNGDQLEDLKARFKKMTGLLAQANRLHGEKNQEEMLKVIKQARFIAKGLAKEGVKLKKYLRKPQYDYLVNPKFNLSFASIEELSERYKRSHDPLDKSKLESALRRIDTLGRKVSDVADELVFYRFQRSLINSKLDITRKDRRVGARLKKQADAVSRELNSLRKRFLVHRMKFGFSLSDAEQEFNELSEMRGRAKGAIARRAISDLQSKHGVELEERLTQRFQKFAAFGGPGSGRTKGAKDKRPRKRRGTGTFKGGRPKGSKDAVQRIRKFQKRPATEVEKKKATQKVDKVIPKGSPEAKEELNTFFQALQQGGSTAVKLLGGAASFAAWIFHPNPSKSGVLQIAQWFGPQSWEEIKRNETDIWDAVKGLIGFRPRLEKAKQKLRSKKAQLLTKKDIKALRKAGMKFTGIPRTVPAARMISSNRKGHKIHVGSKSARPQSAFDVQRNKRQKAIKLAKEIAKAIESGNHAKVAELRGEAQKRLGGIRTRISDKRLIFDTIGQLHEELKRTDDPSVRKRLQIELLRTWENPDSLLDKLLELLEEINLLHAKIELLARASKQESLMVRNDLQIKLARLQSQYKKVAQKYNNLVNKFRVMLGGPRLEFLGREHLRKRQLLNEKNLLGPSNAVRAVAKQRLRSLLGFGKFQLATSNKATLSGVKHKPVYFDAFNEAANLFKNAKATAASLLDNEKRMKAERRKLGREAKGQPESAKIWKQIDDLTRKIDQQKFVIKVLNKMEKARIRIAKSIVDSRKKAEKVKSDMDSVQLKVNRINRQIEEQNKKPELNRNTTRMAVGELKRQRAPLLKNLTVLRRRKKVQENRLQDNWDRKEDLDSGQPVRIKSVIRKMFEEERHQKMRFKKEGELSTTDKKLIGTFQQIDLDEKNNEIRNVLRNLESIRQGMKTGTPEQKKRLFQDSKRVVDKITRLFREEELLLDVYNQIAVRKLTTFAWKAKGSQFETTKAVTLALYRKLKRLLQKIAIFTPADEIAKAIGRLFKGIFQVSGKIISKMGSVLRAIYSKVFSAELGRYHFDDSSVITFQFRKSKLPQLENLSEKILDNFKEETRLLTNRISELNRELRQAVKKRELLKRKAKTEADRVVIEKAKQKYVNVRKLKDIQRDMKVAFTALMKAKERIETLDIAIIRAMDEEFKAGAVQVKTLARQMRGLKRRDPKRLELKNKIKELKRQMKKTGAKAAKRKQTIALTLKGMGKAFFPVLKSVTEGVLATPLVIGFLQWAGFWAVYARLMEKLMGLAGWMIRFPISKIRGALGFEDKIKYTLTTYGGLTTEPVLKFHSSSPNRIHFDAVNRVSKKEFGGKCSGRFPADPPKPGCEVTAKQEAKKKEKTKKKKTFPEFVHDKVRDLIPELDEVDLQDAMGSGEISDDLRRFLIEDKQVDSDTIDEADDALQELSPSERQKSRRPKIQPDPKGKLEKPKPKEDLPTIAEKRKRKTLQERAEKIIENSLSAGLKEEDIRDEFPKKFPRKILADAFNNVLGARKTELEQLKKGLTEETEKEQQKAQAVLEKARKVGEAKEAKEAARKKAAEEAKSKAEEKAKIEKALKERQQRAVSIEKAEKREKQRTAAKEEFEKQISAGSFASQIEKRLEEKLGEAIVEGVKPVTERDKPGDDIEKVKRQFKNIDDVAKKLGNDQLERLNRLQLGDDEHEDIKESIQESVDEAVENLKVTHTKEVIAAGRIDPKEAAALQEEVGDEIGGFFGPGFAPSEQIIEQRRRADLIRKAGLHRETDPLKPDPAVLEAAVKILRSGVRPDNVFTKSVVQDLRDPNLSNQDFIQIRNKANVKRELFLRETEQEYDRFRVPGPLSIGNILARAARKKTVGRGVLSKLARFSGSIVVDTFKRAAKEVGAGLSKIVESFSGWESITSIVPKLGEFALQYHLMIKPHSLPGEIFSNIEKKMKAEQRGPRRHQRLRRWLGVRRGIDFQEGDVPTIGEEIEQFQKVYQRLRSNFKVAKAPEDKLLIKRQIILTKDGMSALLKNLMFGMMQEVIHESFLDEIEKKRKKGPEPKLPTQAEIKQQEFSDDMSTLDKMVHQCDFKCEKCLKFAECMSFQFKVIGDELFRILDTVKGILEKRYKKIALSKPIKNKKNTVEKFLIVYKKASGDRVFSFFVDNRGVVRFEGNVASGDKKKIEDLVKAVFKKLHQTKIAKMKRDQAAGLITFKQSSSDFNSTELKSLADSVRFSVLKRLPSKMFTVSPARPSAGGDRVNIILWNIKARISRAEAKERGIKAKKAAPAAVIQITRGGSFSVLPPAGKSSVQLPSGLISTIKGVVSRRVTEAGRKKGLFQEGMQFDSGLDELRKIARKQGAKRRLFKKLDEKMNSMDIDDPKIDVLFRKMDALEEVITKLQDSYREKYKSIFGDNPNFKYIGLENGVAIIPPLPRGKKRFQQDLEFAEPLTSVVLETALGTAIGAIVIRIDTIVQEREEKGKQGIELRRKASPMLTELKRAKALNDRLKHGEDTLKELNQSRLKLKEMRKGFSPEVAKILNLRSFDRAMKKLNSFLSRSNVSRIRGRFQEPLPKTRSAKHRQAKGLERKLKSGGLSKTERDRIGGRLGRLIKAKKNFAVVGRRTAPEEERVRVRELTNRIRRGGGERAVKELLNLMSQQGYSNASALANERSSIDDKIKRNRGIENGWPKDLLGPGRNFLERAAEEHDAVSGALRALKRSRRSEIDTVGDILRGGIPSFFASNGVEAEDEIDDIKPQLAKIEARLVMMKRLLPIYQENEEDILQHNKAVRKLLNAAGLFSENKDEELEFGIIENLRNVGRFVSRFTKPGQIRHQIRQISDQISTYDREIKGLRFSIDNIQKDLNKVRKFLKEGREPGTFVNFGKILVTERNAFGLLNRFTNGLEKMKARMQNNIAERRILFNAKRELNKRLLKLEDPRLLHAKKRLAMVKSEEVKLSARLIQEQKRLSNLISQSDKLDEERRLLDSNTRRLQDLAQEVEEAGQKSDPNLQLNLLRPLRRESKDLTRKQVVLLKNIELKEKQKFGNKIKNQNAKILTLQNQLSDLLNQNLKTLAQILAAKIT